MKPKSFKILSTFFTLMFYVPFVRNDNETVKAQGEVSSIPSDITSSQNKSQILHTGVDDDREAQQLFQNITILLTNLSSRFQDFIAGSPEADEAADGISSLVTAIGLQFLQYGSAQCLQELYDFATALTSLKLWAISTLNSFGMPPNGILKGNLKWPGSYSSCISKNLEALDKQLDVKPFQTQFCWAHVRIKLLPGLPLDNSIKNNSLLLNDLEKYLEIATALCVPASCSGDFIMKAAKDIQDLFPLSYELANVSSVNCIPPDQSILKDVSALIAIFFCALLTILLIVGTVYDVFYHTKFQQQNYHYLPCATDESDTLSPKLLQENLFDKFTTAQIEVNGKVIDNETVANEHHEQEDMNPRHAGEILLAFSLYTNAKKILSVEPGKESICVLSGIRVFAMCWVIFGHTTLESFRGIDNIADMIEIKKKLWFGFVVHALRNMDTFFVISGVLVAYNILKIYDTRKGKIPWHIFYAHRLWRLTPAYMFVMFVLYMTLSNYFIDSPFWPYNRWDNDQCHKHWWWNIFYIHNLFPMKDQCMPYTWYLDVDTQLYVLSPIILIPLCKGLNKLAYIIAGIFTLISVTCLAGISAYYDIIIDYKGDLLFNEDALRNSFDKMYMKPYIRTGTYAIGILCGCLLYRTKCSITLKKNWVIAGWSAVAFSFFAIIIIWHYVDGNQAVSSIYLPLSNHIWSLAIGWIIVTCTTGYGGIVNGILSWKVWNPFSRLTFMVYLLHLFAVRVGLRHSDILPHLSFDFVFYQSLANIVLSYASALLVSLAIESPLFALEKYFMKKKE